MDDISLKEDTGGPGMHLSIENACQEYTKSVKLTLTTINQQLENSLVKNFNCLEELAVKIAARTSFLEKNPSFLSCLLYNKNDVKNDNLHEFDEIRITLKEHTTRIQEKINEIEVYHKKLFDLVILGGRDQKLVDEFKKIKEEPDEDFHDCLEIPNEIVDLKKATLQKITIKKSAFLDTPGEPPMKFPLFTDILPEVQRGKPLQDLHGKLIQQLVATDSLEGFLKLMQRKPEPEQKRKIKQRKNQDLEEKYTGSLWFFPEKPSKTQSLKSPKKIESDIPEKKSQNLGNFNSTSTCCNLLVTSSQPCPVTNQDRAKQIRQNLVRPRLKCYDLLDDIDRNDVQPIKSEYPRRDTLGLIKLQEAKSYLHRMLDENDKVWKKLLQPPEIKKKKLPPQKARQVTNLIEYLTAPKQKYLNEIPKSLIVMPVKVVYDNLPTRDVLITDLSRFSKDKPKTGRKSPERPRNVPFPLQRKKEMLEQLRDLKSRNDNIQKNIQKAIDVIESKMIDLLSSPTDAASSEAFCAMELEITNVLKMMNDSQPPEKDETRPKLKRGITTVKLDNQNTIQDRRAKLERERSISPEFKKKAKNVKAVKPVKEEETRKVIKPVKEEETRKAANIEEGERLLGQVDSVIKKIDSIYTKFYDDNRTKREIDNSLEIFENLQQIIEAPLECYVSFVPDVYQEAAVFSQSVIEYEARLEMPPEIVKDIPEIQEEIICDEKRHETTLNIIYTFFYTTLLLALNLDFAA